MSRGRKTPFKNFSLCAIHNTLLILKQICHLLLMSLTSLISTAIQLKVMGIPHSSFEEKLEKMKESKGVMLDTDLTAADLKELVEQYKKVYLEVKGEEFPSGTKFYQIKF